LKPPPPGVIVNVALVAPAETSRCRHRGRELLLDSGLARTGRGWPSSVTCGRVAATRHRVGFTASEVRRTLGITVRVAVRSRQHMTRDGGRRGSGHHAGGDRERRARGAGGTVTLPARGRRVVTRQRDLRATGGAGRSVYGTDGGAAATTLGGLTVSAAA